MRTRLVILTVAKEKGLSINRLSRHSDVDLTTLRRLVHEPYTQGVTLATLAKLATALGVHIADLFEELPDE
jgi:lambda repressor-like predicted transcriptional regulator